MKFLHLISLATSLLIVTEMHAAANSAAAVFAMEDATNPLILLSTSAGDIYIELLPAEAPNNVANFLALAHGEIEFLDPNSDTVFRPRYFDGMQFYRVVQEFIIQSGSPFFNPLGIPDILIEDEINANALGLNQIPAMDAQGNFNPILNIGSERDFHETLVKPLYDILGINSESEILERQDEIVDVLRNLTIKEVYENQGFNYSESIATRGITRGIVALANAGPNQNGPEFFIALKDAPWLNGRHTVVGRVVEGIETADTIGDTEIDPLNPSRFAALIYSLRRVN